MSTQEQLNANRTNAQSSTGPKTAEGKAISSQNAVKHGIFAKNDVISGEDLARYEEHRQNIYDEFVPLTPTESVLTQRIASLTWRLMRADRLQTTVINTLVAAQHKATPQPVRKTINIPSMIAELRRKDKDPEYALNEAGIILAGLVHRKHKPFYSDPAVDEAMEAALAPTVSNHICDAEIQLGTVIYNDFQGAAVIERLQSYEQRIESSLFKTIRQMQQVQERRIKQDVALDKMGWQKLHAEDEERKRQREAEYQRKIRNEPNPDVDLHCHSERSRGIRKNTIAAGDSNQNAQNEPNSDLTSITEMTYNRSRDAAAKRKDPQPQSPADQPGRTTNK